MRSAAAPLRALPPQFDASTHEVTQGSATSKDGTQVPYFVVRPKAAAGPVPTILYGYGGFQISMTPKYAPHPSPNPNPHPHPHPGPSPSPNPSTYPSPNPDPVTLTRTLALALP